MRTQRQKRRMMALRPAEAPSEPHPGRGAWDLEYEAQLWEWEYNSCPCCRYAPCLFCWRSTHVELGPICDSCEGNLSVLTGEDIAEAWLLAIEAPYAAAGLTRYPGEYDCPCCAERCEYSDEHRAWQIAFPNLNWD